MPTTIPVTTARKNLLSLIDQVDREYARVDLSKNGITRVSLVSSDYLDSLEETIYSFHHSMDAIAEAEDQICQRNLVYL